MLSIRSALASAVLFASSLLGCAADLPDDQLEGAEEDARDELGELTSALLPTRQRGLLIAQNSGKCMTVYKASLNEGAAIIQYTCKTVPTFNQVTMFTPTVVDGYYGIVFGNPPAADHFESCASYTGRSGAVVVQTGCRPEDSSQWWVPLHYADGSFALRLVNTSLCATVHRASFENEARIIMHSCIGGQNQKWRFQPL